MAIDEGLAQRIRDALGSAQVTEKKMFGGIAFMFRGHMCIAAMLCAGACADRPLSIAPDQDDRRIVSQSGQEIRITLGNVGPAQYDTLPQISSTAVRYLGVEVIPPFTPAGPTQQFRFQAVHRGEAIVTFRRLLGDSVVSIVRDTIEVR